MTRKWLDGDAGPAYTAPRGGPPPEGHRMTLTDTETAALEHRLSWVAGLTLGLALLNTALWWTGLLPLITIGLWLWARNIARALGRPAPRHATFGFGIGVTSLVLFLISIALGLAG